MVWIGSIPGLNSLNSIVELYIRQLPVMLHLIFQSCDCLDDCLSFFLSLLIFCSSDCAVNIVDSLSLAEYEQVVGNGVSLKIIPVSQAIYHERRQKQRRSCQTSCKVRFWDRIPS